MAAAEAQNWRGRLAITGMGLVTPVGLYAEAALAALRAGVSRISRIPGVTIMVSEGEADEVKGAAVPVLTEGLLGPERLKAMMIPAFTECLQDAALDEKTRLGVFLGTSGSSPAGRVLNYDNAMRDILLESVPEGIRVERAKLIQSGRASVQRSVRYAAAAIDQGLVDAAIIGAVDSWVTPRALSWLKLKKRLPEFPRHTGNIPGEAAGFLVLESPQAAQRRSARVYAEIVASAGRLETVQWGEANNGVALSQAMQYVNAGVEDAHALVISDLDGERYRALEWVMAEIKGMWYYRTMDHRNPVDCAGDSGAAMGAVMLAWAGMALYRGYAGVPRALVWGASDEGNREAVMVEMAGGVG